MKNFNKKTFYGIETNLFGEIILNGKILDVGDNLIVIRHTPFDGSYESSETVFFGQLERNQESAWELFVNESFGGYFAPKTKQQLFARLPE